MLTNSHKTQMYLLENSCYFYKFTPLLFFLWVNIIDYLYYLNATPEINNRFIRWTDSHRSSNLKQVRSLDSSHLNKSIMFQVKKILMQE